MPRKTTKADRTELVFLESLRRRLPADVPILTALGDLYTAVGRVEEGYAVDLELVRFCPENETVWYNLACSQALLGQADAALDALERAVALGYDDARHLLKDGDLASLREHPRFLRILEVLKSA